MAKGAIPPSESWVSEQSCQKWSFLCKSDNLGKGTILCKSDNSVQKWHFLALRVEYMSISGKKEYSRVTYYCPRITIKWPLSATFARLPCSGLGVRVRIYLMIRRALVFDVVADTLTRARVIEYFLSKVTLGTIIIGL